MGYCLTLIAHSALFVSAAFNADIGSSSEPFVNSSLSTKAFFLLQQQAGFYWKSRQCAMGKNHIPRAILSCRVSPETS